MSGFSFWKKLRSAGDTLPSWAWRMVSVGLRTGFVQQLSPKGILTLARLVVSNPLGAGIIHALNAASFGDRDCIVTRERRLTYQDFDHLLNQFVHGLLALGIERKQRIVLMSPNDWQYLLGFFGAIRGRFAAVHASYRLKADELEYIVTHSGARAVIFAPECWPVVSAVKRRVGSADIAWIATGPVDAEEDVLLLERVLLNQPTTFPEGRMRLIGSRNVVYTSGTTGQPKGAVRDFNNLGATDFIQILERLSYRAGERHLVVCPLYHSGAQAFAAIHTAGGSTLVVIPKFDPEQTLRILHEQKIDSVFLVPTMITQILGLPDDVKQRYRPQLTCLISGAAPFPHPLRQRAVDYFGPVVFDFYGTTENGWLTIVGSEEMLRKPNTVGCPLTGANIQILDDDDRPLPPGEVGRIVATSAMVIDEYHKDASATHASRRGDAQVSGDLGYLDEDGYLFLSGRSSDMIISGGINIYPAEIEQVLIRHKLVQDVAVLGLPNENWGEVVAAFVVGPTPRDEDALKAHCKDHLANFKVPRRWHFETDLPRNPTGKVLKRELRSKHSPE